MERLKNDLIGNSIVSGENIYIDAKAIDCANVQHKFYKRAKKAYGDFLTALGYDWENDPNMAETPHRIAKMFVYETNKGVYLEQPKITSFPNSKKYDGMIFAGNIDVKSLCSHHFQPFVGKAHVAYIPKENGNIIGLSKINRLVDFFARRPQLQENLTIQIHNFIQEVIGDNLGIAVVIEAEHMCVSLRGVEQQSVMKTSKLSGVFLEPENLSRSEFYNFIKKSINK